MSARPRPCGRCPKFDKCWCTLFARQVSPYAPSCKTGRKIMDSAIMKAWRNRTANKEEK